MKVQIITIGEYQISPSISFNLYQFPSPLVTPPIRSQSNNNEEEYFNYFCIEDLFAIFDLDLIKQDLIQSYRQYPGFYCKNENNNSSYIQTHVMVDIALKHHLYNLVDLCRLNDNELLSGAAIPLLKMTTFVRLATKPIKSIIHGFQPRQLDGNEWFFSALKIKLEPFSPTSSSLSPSLSSHSNRRILSPPSSTSSLVGLLPPRRHLSSVNNNMSQQLTTLVVVTEEEQEEQSKLPKPSSLLLKRLAPKHGHKKNLTIMTPSYNEDSTTNGIQSAPLRRTTTNIPPLFNNNSKNKVIKKSSPPVVKRCYKNIPATASAISAPWPQTSAQIRFPSPPIVPSQQPAWSQYRSQQQQKQQLIKTANVPCFPRTPTVISTAARNTSPQPNNNMTQKQKFLQPFEFLYDHIEQTRVLKTTLDDQIRRSSSLMQTLQSSGTMVESLVRRQVRDMMDDEKFESRLRECSDRIQRLERLPTTKDIPISPAVSPTTKEPLVVKDLLAQLMNRIDQLESKVV